MIDIVGENSQKIPGAKRISAKDYGEPGVYVRIAFPSGGGLVVKGARTITSNAIVKIGRTCNLPARDSAYQDDGGYFAYFFKCSNAEEAQMLEQICKNIFRAATLSGKQEYLDVTALAQHFRIPVDKKGPTRGLVEHIASCLHESIVQIAHQMNPVHREKFNFGVAYDVVTEASADTPVDAPVRPKVLQRELFRNGMPSLQGSFQSQSLDIQAKELELRARIETHKCELMRMAAMDKSISDDRLQILLMGLTNVAHGMRPFHGVSRAVSPEPMIVEPPAPERDPVQDFITHQMLKMAMSELSWVDLNAAYRQQYPNHVIGPKDLRGRFVALGLRYEDTTKQIDKRTVHFRGFRGWCLV